MALNITKALDMRDGLGRVAVFYHYFEADPVYRDNLVFFLSTADLGSVDLYLVVADSTIPELPDFPKLKVLNTRNINLDYGGYVQALKHVDAPERYDALIFVNSSVRGPFLPSGTDALWFEHLTRWLSGEVHLVGSSINHLPQGSRYARRYHALFDHPEPLSHVQTTAYAMTKDAFRHLSSIGFYEDQAAYPKEEVIFRYEVRLSQEILAKGWNLAALLEGYRGIDYRKPHEDPNFAAVGGDPLRPRAYFGRTASPQELLFIKTHRSLMDPEDLASWTFTALSRVKDPKILAWAPYQSMKEAAERFLKAAAQQRENHRIGRFRRLTRWLKQGART